MVNEISKIKVNNEIEFCSISDIKTKGILEKAFMNAGISYFIKWENTDLLSKLFGSTKSTIIFCINDSHLEKAIGIIDDLGNLEGDFKLLYNKAKKKKFF